MCGPMEVLNSKQMPIHSFIYSPPFTAFPFYYSFHCSLISTAIGSKLLLNWQYLYLPILTQKKQKGALVFLPQYSLNKMQTQVLALSKGCLRSES